MQIWKNEKKSERIKKKKHIQLFIHIWSSQIQEGIQMGNVSENVHLQGACPCIMLMPPELQHSFICLAAFFSAQNEHSFLAFKDSVMSFDHLCNSLTSASTFF
jgi:hypothetical protein